MGSIEWLSVGEVAKRLAVDRNTVYRWIKRGTVNAKRLPSGQIRICAQEVERLLRE